ncbi:hypothetical protein LWI29_018481 [Acer saccharum]|uniref:ATP-dependent DNA helicase n=1 Tax=Acer saccharum TaxID=4024 RepID=A0AA39VIK1_ACESA|nr:hypothetical protein LWI29_018481 [Acer saccharum]
MNHRKCYEAFDRTFRDILRGSNPDAETCPFGGKPILLGGDFRQILSVVQAGDRVDIVDASLTSSYLWPHFQLFSLKENMRLSKVGLDEKEKQELVDFASWILRIGIGDISDLIIADDEESSWIKVPNDFLVHFDENPIDCIVYSVYTDFDKFFDDSSYLRE